MQNNFSLQSILSKNEKSITFTDKRIKPDSIVKVYTSISDVQPCRIEVLDGIVKVVFNTAYNDLSVMLSVANATGLGLIERSTGLIDKEEFNGSFKSIEEQFLNTKLNFPNFIPSTTAPSVTGNIGKNIWIVYKTKTVPFADGTDFEILNMISAHYNNEIDVADYWAVGDTRIINLNDTSYKFTLLDFNHDVLETPVNNHTNAAVTLGMVECLDIAHTTMNDTNTNAGSWEQSAMRAFLQETVISYLPPAIRNNIKKVIKRTGAGSLSSELQSTADSLFLLSELNKMP